jgi:hypothetical protein
MELIKAKLVINPQQDQRSTGHAYSQSKDIDQGECFLTQEVTPGDLEVIFEHMIRL